MPGCQDIKKVGVLFNDTPHLIAVDSGRELSSVIEEICNHYHIQPAHNYTLFDDEDKKFLDQQVWTEIRNGKVLKLVSSVDVLSQRILKQLKKQQDTSQSETSSSLKDLSNWSEDGRFAKAFITSGGIQLLNHLIISGKFSGTDLSNLLKSYRDLRDHNFEPWNNITEKFILVIATSLNSTRTMDDSIILLLLDILESIIIACPDKYSIIEKEVTPTSLMPHLQSSEEDVQVNALAVLNALFLVGGPDKKRKLGDSSNFKPIRSIIQTCLMHRNPASNHICHQLHRLQCMLFNLVHERSLQRVDPNDPEAIKMLTELRQIAFDTESDTSPSSKRESQLRDFKKLGFQNVMNPLEDLQDTPPGMLCLQCMHYFAKYHRENYTMVVLENSRRKVDHELPFARSSVLLTKLLCAVLNINMPASEDSRSYHQLFFSNDQSFEEFYCICLQLFNKTWKEMKASKADFNTVLEVVEEQISMSLDSEPTSFEQLRNKLSKLPYQEVNQLRQSRQKDKLEWSLQDPPIFELQQKVKPELEDLIKRNRINCLLQGAFFPIKTYRRQDKNMYCRLAASLKTLHYDEYHDTTTPSVEQLKFKISLSEIKAVLVGKDCPHFKKKDNNPLIFSIIPEESVQAERIDLLNFTPTNEEMFNIWIDALNALLNKPMTSRLMHDDMETLLKMEMKLRLLEAEGLTLPSEPPPVPRPPPDLPPQFIK